MQKEPPPFVWAVPDEKNILTWNYIIRGPPDSPFAGGEYHGVLLFPPEYPFKPPGIKMLTPSGRFQPDKKICFSMSDFHPGSWNPAWSVATILTGLLSFMLSDEMTTGSVTTSDTDKRAYALRSHPWNLEQRRFKDAFPDFCTPTVRDLPNMAEKERGSSSSKPPEPSPPGSIERVRSASIALPPPSPTVPGSSNALFRSTMNNAALPATTDNGNGHGPVSWVDTFKRVVWDKWRWGVVLALALIVSRLSSA